MLRTAKTIGLSFWVCLATLALLMVFLLISVVLPFHPIVNGPNATNAASIPPGTPPDLTLGPIGVLEDSSGKLTLDQVTRFNSLFQPFTAPIANYGFTSSAYWFHFVLHHHDYSSTQLFFCIQHPTLDHATLFVISSAGSSIQVDSGDRVHVEDRPYPATSIILPFRLQPGQSEMYLRVQADAAVIIVPWQILDETQLRLKVLSENLYHGGVLGLFLALFAYNLLLYFVLWEPERFYYLAYLVFAFLSVTSLNGFGGLLLYPSSTWFGNEGLPFFGGCTFILTSQFTRLFLSIRDHRWLDRLLQGAMICGALLAFSPFLVPVRVAYQLDLLMFLLFHVVTLVAGMTTCFRGRREARFYILSQASAWGGVLVLALVLRGFLPFRPLLFESTCVGISAEALFLSLCMIDRLRLLRDAKIAAENAARQALEFRGEQLEELVGQRTAELEIARKHAEFLATTDPLTGVHNRRGLFELAERDLQLALRSGTPLSIAGFDLDHFKRINDNYGHAEGDRVLCEVALAVQNVMRKTDLIGRTGGEEFLIVLPDTPIEGAALLAERVRAALEAQISIGDPPMPVTASFGVASLSADCRSLDALQALADQALYVAKRNGRNRVELETAPVGRA